MRNLSLLYKSLVHTLHNAHDIQTPVTSSVTITARALSAGNIKLSMKPLTPLILHIRLDLCSELFQDR